MTKFSCNAIGTDIQFTVNDESASDAHIRIHIDQRTAVLRFSAPVLSESDHIRIFIEKNRKARVLFQYFPQGKIIQNGHIGRRQHHSVLIVYGAGRSHTDSKNLFPADTGAFYDPVHCLNQHIHKFILPHKFLVRGILFHGEYLPLQVHKHHAGDKLVDMNTDAVAVILIDGI